jgi:Ca2+-binding RTX toxin-like protein
MWSRQSLDHQPATAQSSLAAGSLTEPSSGIGSLPPRSLAELASYLATGFWVQTGKEPRSFNVDSTGANANDGVLYYTLDSIGWENENPAFLISEGASVNTSDRDDGFTRLNLTRIGLEVPITNYELIDEAFKYYQGLLGIEFRKAEEYSDDVDIVFIDSVKNPGAFSVSGGTSAETVSGTQYAQDWNLINISQNWTEEGEDYYYQTLLHEIGHALGLGHQGAYNITALGPTFAANDSYHVATMSYILQGDNTWLEDSVSSAYPYTLMSADILALSSLYGITDDPMTNGFSENFAGNTVYGNNATLTLEDGLFWERLSHFLSLYTFTINDPGGLDTLDFSDYSGSQTITLEPSQSSSFSPSSSSVYGKKGNLTLSVGTIIENAITGDGDDLIQGNDYDNLLESRGGNDTLIGGDGGDTLFGGEGNDRLFGGGGSDRLFGGDGSDQLFGEDGDDFLDGGGGRNDYYGGEGFDEVSYLSSPTAINLVDQLRSESFDSIEKFVGSKYNDILFGVSSRGVTIFGDLGDDNIPGTEFDDHLWGESIDFIVNGDFSVFQDEGLLASYYAWSNSDAETGDRRVVYGSPGTELLRRRYLQLSGNDSWQRSVAQTIDSSRVGGPMRPGTQYRLAWDMRAFDPLTSELQIQLDSFIWTVKPTSDWVTWTVDFSIPEDFSPNPTLVFKEIGSELVGTSVDNVRLYETALSDPYSSGNDRFVFNGGSDKVFGNGGEDKFEMTLSETNLLDKLNVFYDGGPGIDTLVMDWSLLTNPVDFVASDILGVDPALSSYSSRNNLSDIQEVYLSFRDVEIFDLKGGKAADFLRGGPGNDTLTGLSGDDILEGGNGINVVDGGEGFDTYVIDIATSSERLTDTIPNGQTIVLSNGTSLQSIEQVKLILVSDRSSGWYNDSIGYLFEQPEEGEFIPAPSISDTPALGDWLTSPAVVLDQDAWRPSARIPREWDPGTETAVIYAVDGGSQGIQGITGSFGVDNSVYVWVNGVYKFGASAEGGAFPGEYSNIDLGDLSPGMNYIQVLRADHGGATGYSIEISRLFTLAGDGVQPGVSLRVTTNPDNTPVVDPRVNESSEAPLRYIFERSDVGISEPLTVFFDVDGSASYSNQPQFTDYAVSGATSFDRSSGTITFPAFQSMVVLQVIPKMEEPNFPSDEGNETVSLKLRAHPSYNVNSERAAVGTIVKDNPPWVSLSVDPASVREDDSQPLVYAFKRTADLSKPLTVTFNIGGTASYSTVDTVNNDYEPTGAATFIGSGGAGIGTVVFAAGSDTAMVSLQPLTDSRNTENTETIQFSLAMPVGWQPTARAPYYFNLFGTNQATGAIVNVVNDMAPLVSITDDVEGFVASGSVTFKFFFSSEVTGFASDDVTVQNGVKGAFTSVDSRTYELMVTPIANAEGSIIVSVRDSAAVDAANTGSAPATYSMLFDTRNDGPASFVITGIPDVGQTLTAVRSADDPDGNGIDPTYTWQASSDGSTWCTISADGPTHTVSVSDAGKQLRVQVAYTDGEGLAESVTTGAVLIPLPNSAPSALNLSATSVTEAAASGSAVATLTTTDPDAGNTFTYSLVSGLGDSDNNAFLISGNQLLIMASPDFAAKRTYTLRLRTTDQGGLSFERAVDFFVNPIGFDAFSYLASYPDLITAFGSDGTAATRHYVSNGFGEGRLPDVFDEFSYLASYPDLITAFGTDGAAATRHYVSNGFGEGRLPDAFDETSYLASYPDLITAFGMDGAAATRHYVSNGFGEGRLPDVFDEFSYLASYPDLSTAFGTDGFAATRHFVEYGFSEGRTLALAV